MSDYDNYLAQRRAAEKARVEAFRALMASVSQELVKLGDPAVFDQRLDLDSRAPTSYGVLRFADGLELGASLSQQGYSAGAKHRLVFSMKVPHEADGAMRSLRDYGVIPYGENAPEISVADDAGPARVAKEIRRRLIEKNDLRGKLAKVLEIQASRAAYANRQDALAGLLFSIAEQQPRNERDDKTIRLYDFAPGVSYGDLTVGGDDSVQIKVSVNGAVAKAFLEMLKARRPEVASG